MRLLIASVRHYLATSILYLLWYVINPEMSVASRHAFYNLVEKLDKDLDALSASITRAQDRYR